MKDLDLESTDFKEMREALSIYKFALSEIETKVNILNEEHKLFNKYNPIEHVKTRLKMPQSIIKKLTSKGLEVSIDNAVKNITDIAGIRIICSFKNDIFVIADMIESQTDIEVVRVRDYVTSPKENGYQSYHMLVKVPVFLSSKTVNTIVEVQIRTSAMDFWASVEHKINYKHDNNMSKQLQEELKECSIASNELDERMFDINRRIKELNEEN